MIETETEPAAMSEQELERAMWTGFSQAGLSLGCSTQHA